MKINKDLCTGCGECITECPLAAIKKDGDRYSIDAGICDNCSAIFDIECVRYCEPGAITSDNGTVPVFDKMWRVRPEHVIWMMALIASRGAQDAGKYAVGHPQWDMKRKLISDAFLNPDLQVRLTRSYDDICARCGAKQVPGHPEVSGKVDDMCFEKLGIPPGAVMRLWDVVKMIEENFSAPFIKTLTPIPDDIYDDFFRFLPPGAKALDS